MTSEAIVTISAAVVALTQFAKWGGVSDKHGPLLVMFIALIGTMMWGYSNNSHFAREMVWPFFAGWISITLNAAGVFGFTRATSEAITRVSPPPPGAGANPTLKNP